MLVLFDDDVEAQRDALPDLNLVDIQLSQPHAGGRLTGFTDQLDILKARTSLSAQIAALQARLSRMTVRAPSPA